MTQQVISGKATCNELENLHGKVASLYMLALEGIEEDYRKKVEEAKQLAKEEFIKPPFLLTKTNLDILKGAQSLLKDNDIIVDLTQTKGGKLLRGKIQEIIERE